MDTDKNYPKSLLERRGDLPPVQFIGILDRHVGMDPIKYDHHIGTETPHLFTFHTEGWLPGHGLPPGKARRSFSINAADLKILMEVHGLLRIQSNTYGEITLYFAEPK